MAVAPDPVLDALDGLERAIDQNMARAHRIKDRIAHIRAERAAGKRYAEIAANEPSPLIVRMVTESATALDTFGVRLRRLEAQALYDEGLTMEQIAVLFGVTRQRVSTLLKQSNG